MTRLTTKTFTVTTLIINSNECRIFVVQQFLENAYLVMNGCDAKGKPLLLAGVLVFPSAITI